MAALPIDAVLPELVSALRTHSRAVLHAPPGAGKTTRVPLALLESGVGNGRIVMLEPRRLAARAAAEFMAASLGENVGMRVGYRIRGESRISRDTRIEVVTEGILTRMIQSDPALAGIGTVIFDEFHERSLNADLGLALTLDICHALREDLVLLVMSATLDADPVAALIGDAPVVTSRGRSHSVETIWLDRPRGAHVPFETAICDLTCRALSETRGGVLVFLPGEREIRRTAAILAPMLPPGCDLHTLFGSMDFRAQRAAIAPSAGRKLVLATSIAETSLTIEDIRIVVDGGLTRRSRFDPGSGMSRLITERVTRAEADQRRGRAGRIAPGWCYRLWARAEEGGLRLYPPAEIETADLAGFALQLALWGVRDPGDLALLTPPPDSALADARSLLRDLGAVDSAGHITDHGRILAGLPLHPRLAHMLSVAGRKACLLAALLADRDPIRSRQVDMALRIEALDNPSRFAGERPFEIRSATSARIRAEAKRLSKALKGAGIGPDPGLSRSQMAYLAYPDRVGLRRKGDAARYILSGGKGAVMADDDPLASTRLIVVTDTDGNPREARIRAAVEIEEAALRAVAGNRIEWTHICEWSHRQGRVAARRQERLGAVILADHHWADAPDDALARAMLEGVRDLGLHPDGAAARLQARVERLRARGENLPDLSHYALMDTLEDWLLPYLKGVKSATDWKSFDLHPPLQSILSWDELRRLDGLAPAHFTTPLNSKIAIDYTTETPAIAVRLQEMFGVDAHPIVAGEPLRITLLSPAGRPLQTTTDISGFWKSSYADVRKDMRGRYPKHPWPEDPAHAIPTRRTKRRG